MPRDRADRRWLKQLAAAGGIHLDLYLTGYRTIPVIGWLFLLQTITAFGLAVLIVVSRNWLISAAGAAFALSTLGGYLLSVWIGLFGFREVRTTAGILAGVIEVAASPFWPGRNLASLPPPSPARGPALELAALLRAAAPLLARAVAGLGAVALALLGVAAASVQATYNGHPLYTYIGSALPPG